MRKLFVGYASSDKATLDALLPYLQPLSQTRQASVWSDAKIPVGNSWAQDIDHALATCDVALVLVSQAFLTSDFIRNTEMPALLARRATGKPRIFPLFLNSTTPPVFTYTADDGSRAECDLRSIQGFKPHNTPAKPLSKTKKRPDAWPRCFTHVYTCVAAALEAAPSPGGPGGDEPGSEQEPAVPTRWRRYAWLAALALAAGSVIGWSFSKSRRADAWRWVEARASAAPGHLELTANASSYRVGDPLVLTVRSPDAGHLVVVSVEDVPGSSPVELFPNRWHESSAVPAGEVEIPGDRAFELRASTPGDTLVAAFWSKDPLRLDLGAFGERIFRELPAADTKGFEAVGSQLGRAERAALLEQYVHGEMP